MKIIRDSPYTERGSNDWFTGAVYNDTIASTSESSRLSAIIVHFAPGARTAWHTHPHGQTLYVTEGVGRCQRQGGPLEIIRSGDQVFSEPGECHWHGADPDRFMTHLAMQEADENGKAVMWAEQVTDEEYMTPPPG
jgi:quercetin dioxygenase-like cupin family protein